MWPLKEEAVKLRPGPGTAALLRVAVPQLSFLSSAGTLPLLCVVLCPPAPIPAEGRAEGMLSAPCDADKPKLALVGHQHRSVLTRGSWWLFSTMWGEVRLQVLNDK